MRDQNNNKRPQSYFVPQGITEEYFNLNTMSRENRNNALRELIDYIDKTKASFLGYQANQALTLRRIAEYLDVSPNNIGDPFSCPTNGTEKGPPADGYFTLNAKWIERAVLDYFAKLWYAKYPHRVRGETNDWLDTYWGCVLSMGSTEGNLLGLRNARDYLSGVLLRFEDSENSDFSYQMPQVGGRRPNEFRPILFYSEASHYSVKKLAHMLRFPTFYEIGTSIYPRQNPIRCSNWPKAVPTDKHGRINIEDLEKLAQFFLERRYPIAVVFNYGTTWTGAYDDVAEAVKRLQPLLVKSGMYERNVSHVDEKGNAILCKRKGFWYHVDGALGAAQVPYYRITAKEKNDLDTYPDFDFEYLDIQSMVVSGHKWLGAPMPCGVFMTKNRYLLTSDLPDYVGSLDSTLAGSRSALAAIVLWDTLAQKDDNQRGKEFRDALKIAEWAHGELVNVFGESRVHWDPRSIAVVFPRPKSQDIVEKYSLASIPAREKPIQREAQSHIFVMPHVTRELIQGLINEIKKSEGQS